MNTKAPQSLTEQEPEKFTFSVDSALLGELGEKLVSNVHVALSELVKNAYDADATIVKLSILPEGSSTRIVIDDDGVGMTLDEVKSYWMRIGTTNKVDQPTSSIFGRQKTGAKGVGRFACRRLGLKLKLTTTARIEASAVNSRRTNSRETFQTTTITFDWEKFIPGIRVEEVTSEGNTTISSTGVTGTRLEIWGARKNEWSRSGLDYLQRQLGILASNMGAKRPGYQEDMGFNVHLNTPLFEGRVVDVRKDVIDAGWGTVTAYVDKQGHAICTLNALGIGGQKHIKSKRKFNEIAGATMTIGILPLEKSMFRKPETLSKYALQTIVTDWGGVHVRYNGFRVYPYGDSEDDWLKIEADRARRLGKPTDEELFQFAGSLQGVDPGRSLLNMLSRRNYLGHVEVTSAITGLVPRLDRQGFLDSTAFDQLKIFVRFAIDWANLYREFYIRTKIDSDASFALEAVKSVLHEEVDKAQLVPKVASYLRKEIKKIVQYLPEDAQKRTEQSLLTTLHAIETNNEANIRQLEHLRLIASASTLTLLFAHEVRTLIGTLGATSKRLKRIAAKTKDKNSEELNALANQIEASKSRFDSLVEMTGIVGAFGKQKEMQSIHLRSAVERAIRCFSLVLENYKIQVEVADIPGDLSVGPMVEGEIYTVLINLLSNSIKSLIASGQPSKHIYFRAIRKDSRVLINMLDNGIGLSPGNYEEVFKPFISDPDGSLYDQLEQMANPQDAHIFGTGSGLGLAITRDIVRARKGDICFQAPPSGWSISIEIKLPCQPKS
jgi:signal transduction histidine kinase